MKYKIITIAITWVLLLHLLACSNKDYIESNDTKEIENTHETIQESITTTEPPITSLLSPPLQPVSFASVSELISFLKDPSDIRAQCQEEYIEQFDKMCEAHTKSDWIYQVTSSLKDATVNRIAIYPRAKYEDIGIAYNFKYNEKAVQILIYKTEYSSDITPTISMDSYIEKRFGFDFERINIGNINGLFTGEALFMETKARNTIWGFLDGEHYIVVKSKLPQEYMIEFLKTITIDKIDITN